MSSVGRYLSLGDSRSFELPRNNSIWKRQETKDVLHGAGLSFSADVYLCQTGMKTEAQVPVGKCLRFWSTSARFASVLTRRFGSCDCPRHAGLFEVAGGLKVKKSKKVLRQDLLIGMKSGQPFAACLLVCIAMTRWTLQHHLQDLKRHLWTPWLTNFPCSPRRDWGSWIWLCHMNWVSVVTLERTRKNRRLWLELSVQKYLKKR